jgi:hypothetical protein
VNVGQSDSRNANLIFALPRLGNVVGGLHTHECIHFHPESFFDAQRHIARQIGLTIEEAGKGRARNLQRGGRSGDGKMRRLNDLRADKSPGCGGFFIGMFWYSCWSVFQ